MARRPILLDKSTNNKTRLKKSLVEVFNSSPTTFTTLVALSLPATLSAVHVYRASSSSSASLISNEPSFCTVYLSPTEISRPSFVHVTTGFGMPVVGHVMVIDVLASVVTLSPIKMDTGLRSFDSIAFGSFGVFKTGLECPMRDLTL